MTCVNLNTRDKKCVTGFFGHHKNQPETKIVKMRTVEELLAELEGVSDSFFLEGNSLDLSGSSLTIFGMKLICEVLVNENSQLTRLNLSSCELKPNLGLLLAESIKHKNFKLEKLDLSNNTNLGRKAVVELSKNLRFNRTLKEVDLEYTFYDDDVLDNSFSSLDSNMLDGDDVEIFQNKKEEIFIFHETCRRVQMELIPLYTMIASIRAFPHSKSPLQSFPVEILRRICEKTSPNLNFREMQSRPHPDNEESDDEEVEEEESDDGVVEEEENSDEE